MTTAKNAIDQATNNDGVTLQNLKDRTQLITFNQWLLRKTSKTAIDKTAEAKKAKSIKRLMRQTKKNSSKVDEAVTTAKNDRQQITQVNTAKSNGLDSINNINQRLLRKTTSNAIDKAEIENTKRDRRRKSSSKAKIDEAVNNENDQ